eukprot:TRINITY_DN13359_c0_g1_i1.p1 TRINITY_DN13359_c0_g1~~TRINITY_DN13359_c0_g1_i1.p1  ORF type:complete len:227 (+),score=23.95 TRINITY_DN13359_c0_g1_i1:80-760(+)
MDLSSHRSFCPRLFSASQLLAPKLRYTLPRQEGNGSMDLASTRATVVMAVSFVRCVCRHYSHVRRQASVHAFESWLRASGAKLDGVCAADAGDQRGLCVFAQRAFKEGDLVLSVPRKLCIEVPVHRGDVSSRESRFLTTASESRYRSSCESVQAFTDLSVQLLEQKALGDASAYASYLSLLPDCLPLHPLMHRWPQGMLRKSQALALHFDSDQELYAACHKVMRLL